MNSNAANVVVVYVEGNIGAGKSTFLERVAPHVRECARAAGAAVEPTLVVVPEPVDAWRSVGPDRFNLLGAFYEDPVRHAFAFQAHVLQTRVAAVNRALADALDDNGGGGSAAAVVWLLCERSVYSDRHVFARAMVELLTFTSLEHAVYGAWHDAWTALLPRAAREPRAVVYLDVPPLECAARVRRRARAEERAAVPAEYLSGLSKYHEDAFAGAAAWPGARRVRIDERSLHDLPHNDAVARRLATAVTHAFLHGSGGAAGE